MVIVYTNCSYLPFPCGSCGFQEVISPFWFLVCSMDSESADVGGMAWTVLDFYRSVRKPPASREPVSSWRLSLTSGDLSHTATAKENKV